jgi:hypothetical protein
MVGASVPGLHERGVVQGGDDILDADERARRGTAPHIQRVDHYRSHAFRRHGPKVLDGSEDNLSLP